MFDAQPDFQKRVTDLGRKHAAMSNGYITAMRSDGLIIVKPRRKPRRGFPLRMLLGLALGFFAFKAVMLAALGDITYNERVAKLNQGTTLEKSGAWIMQIDPATKFLSGFIDPFID